MSEGYGMVRGYKFNAVQKPYWEGAETRKCPKCGRKKRQSEFTSDSRWCIECTKAAREERRRARHRPNVATPARQASAAQPKAQAPAPKPGVSRPAAKGPVKELASFSATDAEVYNWLRKHRDASERVCIRGLFEVAEATSRTLAAVRVSLKNLERAGRIAQYVGEDRVVVFVTPCDAPLRVQGRG